MLEVTVEDYLTERVVALGGLCEKHVSPGRRNVPDRLITWPWGTMRLVETKAPRKTPNGGQQRDHARRAKRGVVVAVLDTREKVDRWITLECRDLTSFEVFNGR